jgi:Family of unknown function (DUF5763)
MVWSDTEVDIPLGGKRVTPVAAPKAQGKPVSTKCQRTLPNGNQCKREAVENGYCKQHNK